MEGASFGVGSSSPAGRRPEDGEDDETPRRGLLPGGCLGRFLICGRTKRPYDARIIARKAVDAEGKRCGAAAAGAGAGVAPRAIRRGVVWPAFQSGDLGCGIGAAALMTAQTAVAPPEGSPPTTAAAAAPTPGTAAAPTPETTPGTRAATAAAAFHGPRTVVRVPSTRRAPAGDSADADTERLCDVLLIQIPHLGGGTGGDGASNTTTTMAEALRNGVSVLDVATTVAILTTSNHPHATSPISPVSPMSATTPRTQHQHSSFAAPPSLRGSASAFGMSEYDSGPAGSILGMAQARPSLGAVWAAGVGVGGGGGGVVPPSRPSFMAVNSRISSANSYCSTTRTSGSWPSRWGIRQLTQLLSAGFASFRQSLARMAEPATGNLRAEAVAELTRWSSRTDLVRAIAQVTDLEIISQGASRSVVCRGRTAGGCHVFIKYTAATGSGDGAAVPATEGLLSRLLVHPNVVRTYCWHLVQVAGEDVYGDLDSALAAAAALTSADRRRQQQQQQQQQQRSKLLKRLQQKQPQQPKQLKQRQQWQQPRVVVAQQYPAAEGGGCVQQLPAAAPAPGATEPALGRQAPQPATSPQLRSLRDPAKCAVCRSGGGAAAAGATTATPAGAAAAGHGEQTRAAGPASPGEAVVGAGGDTGGSCVAHSAPVSVMTFASAAGGRCGKGAAASSHHAPPAPPQATAYRTCLGGSTSLARASCGGGGGAMTASGGGDGSDGGLFARFPSGDDVGDGDGVVYGTCVSGGGGGGAGGHQSPPARICRQPSALRRGIFKGISVSWELPISNAASAAAATGAPGTAAAKGAGVAAAVGAGVEGTAPSSCSPGQVPPLSRAQAVRAWREMQEMLQRLNARPGDYFARIVMEAADQGSLLTAIRQGVFCCGAPAARLHALLLTARDVARGMAHLHRHAVLHGDLKPSNVLLRSDTSDPRGFVALVSDFGLSRIAPQGSLEGSEPFGTVSFMAPEVFAGSRYPSSDVYSFGVLLWQMIGKMPPWPGLRNVQIMMGILQGDLRLAAPAGTHPPLAALLERCLAPIHSARPSFDAIERELEGMLVEAGRALGSHEGPQSTVAATAAVTAAAAAAVAAGTAPAAAVRSQFRRCLPASSSSSSSSSSNSSSGSSSPSSSSSSWTAVPVFLQGLPPVPGPAAGMIQIPSTAPRSGSSGSRPQPLPLTAATTAAAASENHLHVAAAQLMTLPPTAAAAAAVLGAAAAAATCAAGSDDVTAAASAATAATAAVAPGVGDGGGGGGDSSLLATLHQRLLQGRTIARGGMHPAAAATTTMTMTAAVHEGRCVVDDGDDSDSGVMADVYQQLQGEQHEGGQQQGLVVLTPAASDEAAADGEAADAGGSSHPFASTFIVGSGAEDDNEDDGSGNSGDPGAVRRRGATDNGLVLLLGGGDPAQQQQQLLQPQFLDTTAAADADDPRFTATNYTNSLMSHGGGNAPQQRRLLLLSSQLSSGSTTAGAGGTAGTSGGGGSQLSSCTTTATLRRQCSWCMSTVTTTTTTTATTNAHTTPVISTAATTPLLLGSHPSLAALLMTRYGCGGEAAPPLAAACQASAATRGDSPAAAGLPFHASPMPVGYTDDEAGVAGSVTLSLALGPAAATAGTATVLLGSVGGDGGGSGLIECGDGGGSSGGSGRHGCYGAGAVADFGDRGATLRSQVWDGGVIMRTTSL